MTVQMLQIMNLYTNIKETVVIMQLKWNKYTHIAVENSGTTTG